MFGRKKWDEVDLNDTPPGTVTMSRVSYLELLESKEKLAKLRNEKDEWVEERDCFIRQARKETAEIERLREEIQSLRSATFHEVPEKPKRTWSVVYGWGKRKTEDLVKAQNYTLADNDVYQFWNEVRTGKVRLSQNYAGVSELVYERERVVVAEFSGVISVVELTE